MNRALLYFYAIIYAIFLSQKTDFYIVDFILPVSVFLLCAHASFLDVLKNLVKLNFFILLIVAFVALEGAEEKALDIFIRSNLVLFLMLSIFTKSDFFEIARIAAAFRLPKKLVLLIYFSIKSIHTIKKESSVVFSMLKSRGFEGRFGLFTYKTYAYALAQLMRKSYIKTLSLNASLESRGFGGELFFTPYHGTVHFKDFGLLFLFIFFIMVNAYGMLYHR